MRDKEELKIDIAHQRCTWRMPLDLGALDRKIEKLQKLRDDFAKRWTDPKTGELRPPVSAVYKLSCDLDDWDGVSFGDLAHTVDRPMEAFLKPYYNGKRPLPAGRYE